MKQRWYVYQSSRPNCPPQSQKRRLTTANCGLFSSVFLKLQFPYGLELKSSWNLFASLLYVLYFSLGRSSIVLVLRQTEIKSTQEHGQQLSVTTTTYFWVSIYNLISLFSSFFTSCRPAVRTKKKLFSQQQSAPSKMVATSLEFGILLSFYSFLSFPSFFSFLKLFLWHGSDRSGCLAGWLERTNEGSLLI